MATITELQNKIKTSTTENTQGNTNEEVQALKQRLEAVQRDKEAVEKALTQEKAAKAPSGQETAIVCF